MQHGRSAIEKEALDLPHRIRSRLFKDPQGQNSASPESRRRQIQLTRLRIRSTSPHLQDRDAPAPQQTFGKHIPPRAPASARDSDRQTTWAAPSFRTNLRWNWPRSRRLLHKEHSIKRSLLRCIGPIDISRSNRCTCLRCCGKDGYPGVISARSETGNRSHIERKDRHTCAASAWSQRLSGAGPLQSRAVLCLVRRRGMIPP